MKTFVLGDIHGAYKALRQCFDRSPFNPQEDRLIVIGDVCDGYRDVRQCIDGLLAVPHCDALLGNHDQWALQWATQGDAPSIWLTQGGEATVLSYDGGPMLPAHVDFLRNARLWVECDNKLFVHAGIEPDRKITEQSEEILLWDRSLVIAAAEQARINPDAVFSDYHEIFVGHTTTQWMVRNNLIEYNSPKEAEELAAKPMFFGNVVMTDTGAGWGGKLTIMDIHTHEYWQSDPTSELYDYRGR